MNSVESGASDTIPSYPKGKVIGLYGLLGGAIGSLIIGLPITIIGVIASAVTPAGFSVMQAVAILLSIIIIGSLIGLLPSLVTGVFICQFEIYFDSSNKVLSLFTIGFLSTFALLLAMILVSTGIPDIVLEHAVQSIAVIVMIFLPISILGGVSAIITGWFVLPKHQ